MTQVSGRVEGRKGRGWRREGGEGGERGGKLNLITVAN